MFFFLVSITKFSILTPFFSKFFSLVSTNSNSPCLRSIASFPSFSPLSSSPPEKLHRLPPFPRLSPLNFSPLAVCQTHAGRKKKKKEEEVREKRTRIMVLTKKMVKLIFVKKINGKFIFYISSGYLLYLYILLFYVGLILLIW